MTFRQILEHHRDLNGRLRYRQLASAALGIRKSFYVYEPPGLDASDGAALLYLFRGHEREWVNMREDSSRQYRTAIQDLDLMMTEGLIAPAVVVLPGLNSTNNHVPSLGIDMVGAWPQRQRGLGSGRFWTYLTTELMPRIDQDYPQTAEGLRLAAGFSIGGYTVSLLSLLTPERFDHVGIYDGLLMWPGHHDPRYEPVLADSTTWTDPIWCHVPLFDAALGLPRDADAMVRWNPTNRLEQPEAAFLQQLRQTTFWVACAPQDGQHGNLDRSRAFTKRLRALKVPVGFQKVVLHPEARHDWHWADRFLMRFLRRTLPAPQAA